MKLLPIAAVILTASTGVVASIPSCRVSVAWEYRAIQQATHRHVHHSAATLARWKIGSAAWSLAHGGKVYRGYSTSTRVVQDWTPLQFGCSDVAMIPVELGLLVPMEGAPTMPESYAEFTPVATAIPPPVDDAGVPVAGTTGYPPMVSGVPVFGAPVGLPSVPVTTPEPSGWLLVETGIAVLMIARWMKR